MPGPYKPTVTPEGPGMPGPFFILLIAPSGHAADHRPGRAYLDAPVQPGTLITVITGICVVQEYCTTARVSRSGLIRYYASTTTTRLLANQR